jgi:alpha/beta superfamily hydrolase
VTTVDGANHFFFGKLFPLGEVIATWARATFAR